MSEKQQVETTNEESSKVKEPDTEKAKKYEVDPDIIAKAKTIPRRKSRRLSVTDLLKPHWVALIFGFLAVAGEGAANLLQPWPLKVVLDDVLRSKGAHPGFMHWIESVVGNDKLGVLKFACALVIGVAVLDAVCSYAEKYLTTSVGQWITYDLRRTIYAHMQRLSLAFHDKKRTGDLITRVTDDIDAIQSFITSGLLGVIVNLITLAGMVGVMFYLNWRFTLIALSVAPVLFVIVLVYTRKIKKASRAVRRKEGEIASEVEETLSAIRVVKAFAREDYELQKLEKESIEQVDVALRARSLKARLTPIVDVVVAFGTCLVLWFGARYVLAGTLSAGSLVVFILYLSKMYKPMQELSKATDTYTKAAVGYERVLEILETEDEVKDLRNARRAPRFKGNIEFDHVTFGYNEESCVLNDVSFKIEPGQVVALVGPTGAGKSSIISLIPRFYEPVSGTVKIDGTDVRKYRQRSLREQISFVLQDTMLFRASVLQNIAYGRPEATRDEIIKAAELANAAEFIDKMPEGYDTMLGERGMTLSGGQRQRIAIARAVIRNAPILILDEPSSGLDSNSEKQVFDALDKLMKNRTTIVIAHRLSTIQNADVIFVINEGTIVEQGTHDQLMKNRGLYQELHEIQFKTA